MATEKPPLRWPYEQIPTEYLSGLTERLGSDSPLQVQTAKDKYSLADTKGAFVSFLNLASVKALSEFMGEEIDPRRFRMNIWLKGLEPFEELSWVDGYPGTREIIVDGVRMRVDDACERCMAIEANPDTGVYDMKLRAGIMRMMQERMPQYKSPHRQTNCVMGILARPLDYGLIYQFAKIQLA